MTITAEVQAQIDAAVSAATEKLDAKNKELLGELRAAKAKAKGADIDPKEHEALQARVAELEGELDKTGKKLESETKKLQKALDGESAFTRTLLVDGGLLDAAAKAGVKPEYMPAVRALLAPQVQVVQDGDKRVAKIGDKLLTEAVGAWAQTAEGKHYVGAPVNSGGDANGGRGGGDQQGGTPDPNKVSPGLSRLSAARANMST